MARAYAKVKPDWNCWGIIDTNGKYIVKPEFSHIYDWSEGFIRLERRRSQVDWQPYKRHLNGQYAFANRDGRIITDNWGEAGDFHEGRAAVAVNGTWGFINDDGAVVIDFDYQDTSRFQEGLCAVQQVNRWGFIDTHGQLQIPCRFSNAGNFSSGLAVVELDGSAMVIDREGRTIVELPQGYTWGEIKSETLILFGTMSRYPGERYYGFMTVDGTTHTPPEFYTNSDTGFSTWDISEGMLRVADRQGRYGFVDDRGEVVIPCQYEWADTFADGRARARINGQEVYINKQGNTLSPIQAIPTYPYDEVLEYHEGLAAARKGKLWGIIDEERNVVIDFRFKRRIVRCVGDEGLYFSNYLPKFSAGLLAVEHEYDDDRWCGYIDRTGEIAIPFTFKVAEDFQLID